MQKNASRREKITRLTHGTQPISWWLCLGGTSLWVHCLLSVAFACQWNSKHPSYLSIQLFLKFCLYGLLRRADNMRCSKYWQVECPDCNTSVHQGRKTLKTVSRLRQYNRWIIKIITVRFCHVFIIKFSEGIVPRATASFKDFRNFYPLFSGFAHWSCFAAMSL